MKKMRFLSMIIAAILLMSGCTTQPAVQGPRIGIIQLMEHTSLNMIYESFVRELEILGYKDGENCTLVFRNAQGEQSNIASIVASFESEDLDVIVAIATPTAQSAARLAETTPVIFSAVTDPVSAGLTSNLTHPDQNITGTSDEVAVDQILMLAMTLQPQLKTLGMVYNVGEVNSQTNIAKAREAAEALNLEVIEAPVANTSEAAQAVQVLTEKCDALFTPNDNTIAAAMGTVTQITRNAGIPIYVGADSMVMDGGTASIGINYRELGSETAKMTAEVLHGTAVSAIPVKVFNEDLSVYVNEDALKELGLSLPQGLTSASNLILIQDPQ